MRNKKVVMVVQASMIAAIYVVLTFVSNVMGLASGSIQVRLSEALCVFSFFTPAAVWGLPIGCLLFNLTFAAALPLDFLLGSLATYLACKGMWLTRKNRFRGIPILGLMMPAITNAVLVGWELTVYIGGAFWLNALYVALGEWIVLLTLGALMYSVIRNRNLDAKLFV
jgi:uncharacterized membrane protein